LTFAGLVNDQSFNVEPELAHGTRRVKSIPPSPFGRGKGEGRVKQQKFALTSVLSQRERKQKQRVVKAASVSWADRFERFTNQASGSVEVQESSENGNDQWLNYV